MIERVLLTDEGFLSLQKPKDYPCYKVYTWKGTTDLGRLVVKKTVMPPAEALDFGWAVSAWEPRAASVDRGDAIFKTESFRYWHSPATGNSFRFAAKFQAYFASEMERQNPTPYRRTLDIKLRVFIPCRTQPVEAGSS